MTPERADATNRLADVVQEFASAVVPALRGGDGRFDLLGSVLSRPDDPASVAAVRVLGADALAPCILSGKAPTEADVVLVEGAVGAFPPTDGSSAVTEWSHWGMRTVVHHIRTAHLPGPPPGENPADVPVTAPADTDWVADGTWQRMTHQLSQLAALAVPELSSPLHAAVGRRPVDLARGFVRAVRRRDWLQAAGAGRWLAVTKGVPETLGLDTGLQFVHHMGGSDARVALHVRAAQLARENSGPPAVHGADETAPA